MFVTLVGSHHATGAVQAQDAAFTDELQLLPVSRSPWKGSLDPANAAYLTAV